jgi:PAS domain S-box-containing protein
VGLVQDISARKRTEEKLRRSEAFLAEGQKISQAGTWAVQFPSGEVSWSEEVYRIYGVDRDATKLSQQVAFGLIHPEDRTYVKETFEGAVRAMSDFAVEHRAMMADGSIKCLHALGRPVLNDSGELIEYIGTVMDVTARKGTEEELRKIQQELARVTRMTTMGEVAASIAHEINQPLGAIVNNSNVALRLAEAPGGSRDTLMETLSDVVNDATRASAIIARIRALTTQNIPERTSLQLRDVANEALAFAQLELVEHRIVVHSAFAEDLPTISGDRVQIQQVFLNLIMNAIEAMSDVEAARRILTISGELSRLNASPAVLITVHDLGVGFKGEAREHLFEPFYTTKPNSLGMGLRISRSIAEAHGGRLWAQANEDMGATFFLCLPAESSEKL